jgi:hypothetical protein
MTDVSSTVYAGKKYRNFGCERAYARSHPKFRISIPLKTGEPEFNRDGEGVEPSPLGLVFVWSGVFLWIILPA